MLVWAPEQLVLITSQTQRRGSSPLSTWLFSASHLVFCVKPEWAFTILRPICLFL